MRALVIDDSRAARSILRRLLEMLEFEVLEASDGRAALQVLEEEGHVDLALVDWNMPGMDGHEFVCAVRADSDRQDLTLLMVTAENELSQVSRALEAGVNEYLMKPFDLQTLSTKLELLGMRGG